MNIYWRELKTYKKSTLIWTFSLTALAIFYLTMFPSFTKDAAASRQALSSLPVSIRNAFDLSLDSFFTILGFYSYVLSFVLLAGAVQAMNLGTGLISKENAYKTADFLLSKPISRVSIVTNKILAALSVLFITNVVFISFSFVYAQLISKANFSSKKFLMLALILFFIQIIFLSIGIFFSVALPKVKSVLSISLPVVFGFYIIGTLGAIIGNDNVRYISPFKFFSTDYIIRHGQYESLYIIIEFAIIIMAISCSYLIYIKKDVRSAS
ncbi:MAG TPA: ABC transporter permease subunit [Candidatus Saccharimonadales bacterium]|nr:ABC transporter permease subunit [Candidatus Saccharimonadales bacterium]